MASNSPSPQRSKDQAKKKGKNTPEYKKVKENMNDFIDAIESIEGAVEKLQTMFMENGWLETNPNKISAKNLITQALNRISNDSREHVVFLQMLQKITGMDQMVERLTGMYYTPLCLHTLITKQLNMHMYVLLCLGAWGFPHTHSCVWLIHK